jgi:acetolactate synthase-1/2/3 large subunit
MPQDQLFQGITKWSERIPSAELVPSFLARAFRVARAARPGPVFLEIPWDVLSNGADEALVEAQGRYRTDARAPGDPAKIEEALALLARAERPVLVGGTSIWWDDAVGALERLATRTGIPVFLNGMGRGCLPPDHPSSFHLSRREALAEADVVVVVGTPLDFRIGYGGEPTFAGGARVVQVDIEAAEIGRNRPIDVGIVGDARSALVALADGARATPAADAFRRALREKERARAERQRAFEESDQRPIHHFRLAKAIDTVARGADTTFVCDGGNVVAVAAKTIRVARPGRWLDPGPLGTLGVGAPFAIAAKLLAPERPVCVVQGDGSFGLNGMDYETAVRFKLPMVVVVGNDAAWGQILIPQRALYGEAHAVATRLAPTRYDRVVEALGGKGEHVEEPADLVPALERAFASGTVYCVDVAIDPEAAASSGAAGYAI